MFTHEGNHVRGRRKKNYERNCVIIKNSLLNIYFILDELLIENLYIKIKNAQLCVFYFLTSS
jgi:hypothetical protein